MHPMAAGLSRVRPVPRIRTAGDAVWCSQGRPPPLTTLETRRPVVVLHCARHGGLGILRSLGRLGVPVYPITAGSSAPAYHSRYASGQFDWDIDASSAGATLEFLEHVAWSVGEKP